MQAMTQQPTAVKFAITWSPPWHQWNTAHWSVLWYYKPHNYSDLCHITYIYKSTNTKFCRWASVWRVPSLICKANLRNRFFLLGWFGLITNWYASLWRCAFVSLTNIGHKVFVVLRTYSKVLTRVTNNNLNYLYLGCHIDWYSCKLAWDTNNVTSWVSFSQQNRDDKVNELLSDLPLEVVYHWQSPMAQIYVEV